ncbi:hypothetical protein LTR53_010678 [Teratosphaeriaceae sp. CCFEE 6253]|nr:hypothetical protein LTR53_010678 [Teratosphaeriaceae sp. CCFEE 6253]
MAPKVLIVLSSHDKLGDTGKKTGWYLPEFAHPYYKLAGKADLTIASPKGGAAPLDESSVQMFTDAESVKFLQEQEALWTKTAKLSTFLGRAGEFDAVFYVGGHGPMFDLAVDADSQQLIREFYEAGKIVSAVCHGPIVLGDVKLTDGSFLVNGLTATGFTNAEEDQVGLSSVMPVLLETKLKDNGARFEQAEPWAPFVVQGGDGGRVITGQNPASAGPIGDALVAALGA